jgi:hypothetical protein
MDAAAARKKAQSLLNQAFDPSTTPEEAVAHFAVAKKLAGKWNLKVGVVADEDADPLGGILTPDVVGLGKDLVDLVSVFKRSGLGDSIRRVVSSSKKAARSTGARRRNRGL